MPAIQSPQYVYCEDKQFYFPVWTILSLSLPTGGFVNADTTQGRRKISIEDYELLTYRQYVVPARHDDVLFIADYWGDSEVWRVHREPVLCWEMRPSTDTTSLRPVGKTWYDDEVINVVKSQGKFYDAQIGGVLEHFEDLLSTLEYLRALRHVKRNLSTRFVRQDGSEIKAGDME